MVDNRIKGVEHFHRENFPFWKIKCIRKGWKKKWTNMRRHRLLRFPYRFLNRSLIDLTGNVRAIKKRVKISCRGAFSFELLELIKRFIGSKITISQIVRPFPFLFPFLLIAADCNYILFFFFRLFVIFRSFLVFLSLFTDVKIYIYIHSWCSLTTIKRRGWKIISKQITTPYALYRSTGSYEINPRSMSMVWRVFREITDVEEKR